MPLTEIAFGIINPEYYRLIAPLSLIALGAAINLRAKNPTYVGRLTMFSNSMALTGFYITIPTTPWWMILTINFSIILGVVGLLSYSNKLNFLKLNKENYYKYTNLFHPLITGTLILLYYFMPNLFV